jgi:hypothetical protein
MGLRGGLRVMASSGLVAATVSDQIRVGRLSNLPGSGCRGRQVMPREGAHPEQRPTTGSEARIKSTLYALLPSP